MDPRLILFDEIEAKADEDISNGFNGKAIVAFIDLLGFRNEILAKWKNKKSNPLKKLMSFKSYNTIAKKRAENHDFFDNDGNHVVSIPYPEIITFSDSFIFIQPLVDNSADQRLYSILSIVGSIAELWRISINNGFTIRGGVDFDEIYHNGKDLVGPALIKAYEIESKICQISRVVFSSSILEIISSNLSKTSPITQEYYKCYLTNDMDQLIILNPIIIYGYDNPDAIDDAIEKLEEMRNKCPSFKLKSKYTNIIARLRNKINPHNDFKIFDAY